MSILTSTKYFINSSFSELDSFIRSLPETFKTQGTVIRDIRNEIRLIEVDKYKLVVKSYKVPNVFNKVAYSILRKSKAQRAYEYAELFLSRGIGSPTPVAYITERRHGLFSRSFFISLLSDCPYTYYDFFEKEFSRKNEILEEIALVTARMHDNNCLHNDYTGGNILFDDTPSIIPIEIIDLNRMSFRKIDMRTGCENFGKLQATEEMLEIMGKAYAKARGFDEDDCVLLIKKYNKSWETEV